MILIAGWSLVFGVGQRQRREQRRGAEQEHRDADAQRIERARPHAESDGV